jgi:glycine betaine/choline ABC-type transport system substrate-binding protein
MKVVNPNDTTHTIKLIPRFYGITSIDLSLYNEATQETTSVTDVYSVTSGVASVVFDFTFLEDDKYQFKLVDGATVVYRGKLIATSQEPQQYKLDNGLYSYE